MSAARNAWHLDRFSAIGEISDKARTATKRILMPAAVVLVAEVAFLGLTGRPGAAAFAAMSIGTWVSLAVWSSSAIGLPLLPMMSLQALVIYGIPIVAGHDVILTYPPSFVTQAGIEVMTFGFAMCGAWFVGMRLFRPASGVSHTLHEFNKAGAKGWSKVGFGIVVGVTAFQILEGLNALGGVLALLPSGSDPILYALVSVASACGFFLVALVVGSGAASVVERILFWGLLIANGMFASEDFILSSAAGSIVMILIGLFWGSGKLPWRFLTVAVLTLSFFNLGKTAMRAKYWETDDSPGIQFGAAQLPAVYIEWLGTSFDAMMENNFSDPKPDATGAVIHRNQTLLDRLDNLQNLLFVIDAEESNHISPLEGQTYAIIPPLLIPRIFWPEKPRTHEGQILLNVHFGRQDLESTFTTYIAWGLLPEAYGNFGPYFGSIAIGGFLGVLFAWIENYTTRKLVVSLEGFLSLIVTVSLMNSFEMVASVLVTSIFQSMIIIFGACLPFVHRPSTPMRTTES